MTAYHMMETRSDQEFVATASGLMEQAIVENIEKRGRAIVGLSGGSTPRQTYGALGQAQNIDWSKVWVFLIDDRYVRKDSPHSNQFLVRSTLLRNAPIPESQLLFPDTTLAMERCVGLYEEHLRDLLRKGSPDIVTLGLGEDFHTASLFPPVPEEALSCLGADACLSGRQVRPASRLVIHTRTDRFAIPDRISVTIPVLAQARSQLLLLKGKAKRATWQAMMESPDDPKTYPLQAIMKEGQMTVVALW